MVKHIKCMSTYTPPKVKAFRGACHALNYDTSLYYAEVFDRKHIGYYIVLVPECLPPYLVEVASSLGVLIAPDIPSRPFYEGSTDKYIVDFIHSLPYVL